MFAGEVVKMCSKCRTRSVPSQALLVKRLMLGWVSLSWEKSFLVFVHAFLISIRSRGSRTAPRERERERQREREYLSSSSFYPRADWSHKHKDGTGKLWVRNLLTTLGVRVKVCKPINVAVAVLFLSSLQYHNFNRIECLCQGIARQCVCMFSLVLGNVVCNWVLIWQIWCHRWPRTAQISYRRPGWFKWLATRTIQNRQFPVIPHTSHT